MRRDLRQLRRPSSEDRLQGLEHGQVLLAVDGPLGQVRAVLPQAFRLKSRTPTSHLKLQPYLMNCLAACLEAWEIQIIR